MLSIEEVVERYNLENEISNDYYSTFEGIVMAIAYIACRESDKETVLSCSQILKKILSIAKSRGYEDERDFLAYFSGNNVDNEMAKELVKHLYFYISLVEIFQQISGLK